MRKEASPFVPVVCGTAFKNKGVQPMLDAVVDYLPSPLDIPAVSGIDPNIKEETLVERKADDKEPFSALAFKIMTDPFVGQLTFFRVYSGTLTSGSSVSNSTKDKTERIGRLLKMHANKREEIKEVNAGDIAAAVGLKSTTTGDTLCDEKKPIILEQMVFPEPVISLAIEPKTKADQEKLGQGMAKLMAEDPTFRVHTDEQTNQVVIAGMGELHLEIIVDRLKREFGVEASVGKPQVAYKETLTVPAEGHGRFIRQTGGRGQFGEAKIRLIPLAPGTGYQFENDIKGGSIPKEYIKPIDQGIQEALTRGILAGYPIDDVRIELYDGSYHDVDSSEMAFKIAGSMAFQDAAKKAKPGVDGTDHARRSGVSEGLPRRRDRRPGVASRQDPVAGRSRRHADHLGAGPVERHVRLRHRPAFAHPGPRRLFDVLRPLRTGAAQRERRGHRPRAGYEHQVAPSPETRDPTRISTWLVTRFESA